MSPLALDERNTPSRGTRLAGESRDWAANDYVQAKTRLNRVTGICGIGALERVKGPGIEASGEIAADADDAITAQAVSYRSAWALMHRPLFRALWIASLTSSIGTWMHEVGAAWLMTSLTSPTRMRWSKPARSVEGGIALSLLAVSLRPRDNDVVASQSGQRLGSHWSVIGCNAGPRLRSRFLVRAVVLHTVTANRNCRSFGSFDWGMPTFRRRDDNPSVQLVIIIFLQPFLLTA